jgi:hypothetical protein
LYSLAYARSDQTGESNSMTTDEYIRHLVKERDRLDLLRSEITRDLEQYARTLLLTSARVAGLDVTRMPDWLLTRHLLDLQERSRLPGFTEWVERQPRLSPEMSARLERELSGDRVGPNPNNGDEDQSVRPIALCLLAAASDKDSKTLEQLGLNKKIKLATRSPVEVWEGFCNSSDLKQFLATYGGGIIDLPPREPSRTRKKSVRNNPASRRRKAGHADNHRAVPDADLAKPSHTGGGSEQSRDINPTAAQGFDMRSSAGSANGSPSGAEPQGTPPVHNATSLRSPDPYQRAGALGPIRVPAAGQPAHSGDTDPPADESSQKSNSTDPVTKSQS